MGLLPFGEVVAKVLQFRQVHHRLPETSFRCPVLTENLPIAANRQ